MFADLGLNNAEELQTKARLAFAINQILDAAEIDAGGRSAPFECEPTQGFSNVEILIRAAKSRKTGRNLVTAA